MGAVATNLRESTLGEDTGDDVSTWRAREKMV